MYKHAYRFNVKLIKCFREINMLVGYGFIVIVEILNSIVIGWWILRFLLKSSVIGLMIV